MIKRHRITTAILIVVAASIGWANFADSPAALISDAASKFLDSLSDEQKAKAVMPYDSEQRVDWHFIPKKERKGAIYSAMNGKQKKAAMALMASTLYGWPNKSTIIIALVRLVILASTDAGSRQKYSGSISANTGIAP